MDFFTKFYITINCIKGFNSISQSYQLYSYVQILKQNLIHIICVIFACVTSPGCEYYKLKRITMSVTSIRKKLQHES